MAWIDLLKQLELTTQIDNLFAAMCADPNAFGAVVLSALCVAWLVRLWRRRYRPSRRRLLSLGIAVAAGIFHFLAGVVLFVFGLVFAVARAAGRSTFYTRSRF